MSWLLWFLSVASMAFFQSAPPPAVHAVFFWSPDCSFCQAVLAKDLPPLEAKYGSQLQIQKVPLVSASDVDTLFNAAGFFGLKKDEIVVPFLVVGNKTLAGQDAIEKQFAGIIEAGLAQGGIPAPLLPQALADLVARPTPTPRPTIVAIGSVPLAPGEIPSPTSPGGGAGCAAGGKTSCDLQPSQLTPAPAGPFSNPVMVAGVAAAGVLALAGLAWFIISRRRTS
jgi:hypothetical protein